MRSHRDDRGANASSTSQRVLVAVREAGTVATTSEVAKALAISWNTAEKHLLELALEQKLVRLKKAGVNLWVLR